MKQPDKYLCLKVGSGLPLFTSSLEEVFSETQIAETETLCTSVPQAPHLPPDRHMRLPQDVGVFGRYAGLLPPQPPVL